MLIDTPFTTILNKYRKTIYHGSLEIMLNFQATPTKLMIDIFPKFDQCDTEMQFTYKLAIVCDVIRKCNVIYRFNSELLV